MAPEPPHGAARAQDGHGRPRGTRRRRPPLRARRIGQHANVWAGLSQGRGGQGARGGRVQLPRAGLRSESRAVALEVAGLPTDAASHADD
eukprot:1747106-Pyramimonas_sp.AAC.1